MGFGKNTDPGHNSASGNSGAEINKLSSELNSRLSREMDEMMTSVNVQIQRAISDAISNQLLPQIQNALKFGSGHLTRNRWNVPVERPGIDSKDNRYKIRENSRSEPVREGPNGEFTDQAYDSNSRVFSLRERAPAKKLPTVIVGLFSSREKAPTKNGKLWMWGFDIGFLLKSSLQFINVSVIWLRYANSPYMENI